MAWGREKKGISCIPNEDGSETCKRVIRAKDGQLVTDGQEWTIEADPSKDCEARIGGDLTVFDDDWKAVEDSMKRVKAGCKRNNSKGGYS